MKNLALILVLLSIETFFQIISAGNDGETCSKSFEECEKVFNGKKKQGLKLCGSNNVTYVNRCFLEMDVCIGNKVTIKHKGRCRTRQPCFRELKKAERNRKNQEFVPTCLKDGTFSPMQCHNETGFCWCVTPKGKLIPNSAKRHDKPNCSRKFKMRRRASVRKDNKEICGPNDKQKFSENLLNLFRAEYGKDLNEDVDTVLLNQKILNWKFQSIDRNDDEYLQRAEYKVLRRLKKLIKPKKCAKTFAKMCDLDRDFKISKSEWSACLGVSMITLKGSPIASLSGQLPGFEHVNRKDQEPEANDCFSDRQAVLAEQRSNNLYVPECTPDGRYNRIQCYKSTGYCWCVNEDDGKPIPGTSVKDQLPKCDSVPVPIRPMKGCPGQKKEIFLKGLMEFLADKVISKNVTQYSMEQVVSLSFLSLDSNNNKYLDRKEWKNFRTLIVDNKNLRRCGKRLPRFCDINNDRRISITEWTNCLHRRGPNPLKSYLKDDD